MFPSCRKKADYIFWKPNPTAHDRSKASPKEKVNELVIWPQSLSSVSKSSVVVVNKTHGPKSSGPRSSLPGSLGRLQMKDGTCHCAARRNRTVMCSEESSNCGLKKKTLTHYEQTKQNIRLFVTRWCLACERWCRISDNMVSLKWQRVFNPKYDLGEFPCWDRHRQKQANVVQKDPLITQPLQPPTNDQHAGRSLLMEEGVSSQVWGLKLGSPRWRGAQSWHHSLMVGTQEWNSTCVPWLWSTWCDRGLILFQSCLEGL